MNEIFVKPGGEIDLGKRGEHLARCIVFDISDWQKTYGEGSVHLLHQRNGDKAPYPCVVETDGPYVRWLLSETDVDVAGRGRAELQYFVDEARVKSETWITRTHRSMNNEGPIPEEPAVSWLNAMLELGTETQENAEIAERHAETAKQHAESAERSAAEAKSSAQNAADCENLVYEHAQDARAASERSEAAMNAAEAAQIAAEKARDETQAIAGGDIASTVYVNNQIGEHNTNTSAHADIRKIIDDLTAEDVGAVSKLGDEMSGDLRVKKGTPAVKLVDTTNSFASSLETGNHFALLTAQNNPTSTQNYRALMVCDSDSNDLAGALKLRDKVDGTVTNYNVYHTGNKPTAADVGAAPAGYGLGTAQGLAPELDANKITASGIYGANKNTPTTDSTWTVYAIVGTAEDQIQYAYDRRGSTGAETARLLQRRVCDGGTWKPWEYVNPPMTLGVEYRTTERYMGKPVYTKAVNFGALPNASTKTVSLDSSVIEKIVDWSARFASDSADAIPWSDGSSKSVEVNYVSPYGIRLKTNYDASASGAHFTVRYTKKAD